MSTVASNHGSDHGRTIHQRRQFRKDLTDLNARHVGRDWSKLPTDFGRSVRLNLPHVLMGWSTSQEDVDNRFVSQAGRAAMGTVATLCAEDIGKAQATGPKGQTTDGKKAAAGDTVAKATRLAKQRKHDGPTSLVNVLGGATEQDRDQVPGSLF